MIHNNAVGGKRYWARGDCRHGGLHGNGNRFATLQPPDNSPRNNYGRAHNDGRSTPPQNSGYMLSRDSIIADLSTERPQWILSSYAPGLKAPAQLFGGPVREQSFEEMRLHYYNGIATGNPALSIQQAEVLVQEAESQIRNALSDVDGAIEFILKAEQGHPNRIDVCQNSTNTSGVIGATSNNNFSSNKGNTTQLNGAFGQPSTLGAKPNPFGVSSQTTGVPGSFGQPSSLGQKSNPFGQPSALGQRPNPFGQPAAASAPGQAVETAPRPFSAYATGQNPFTGQSQSVTQNPFGQAVQSNPFGRPVQSAQTAVDVSAQTQVRPNPFGQADNQPLSNPFGAPSPGQRNPFGGQTHLNQGNPLVQVGIARNPFNQAQPVAPPSNPFAEPPSAAPPNPISQAPTPAVFSSNQDVSHARSTEQNVNGVTAQGPYGPNAEYQHPPLHSYTSRDNSNRLTMFRGKPVVYRDSEAGFQNRDGTWEKIWFPDGPLPYYGATEMNDNEYNEETKAAYTYFREKGSFKDGIMPFLPPKREWCLWDF